MPCFHPLHGWRSIERNSSGKRGVRFNPKYALRDLPVTVPCGTCDGCRLERSRQWAVRCLHEASLYKNNCFLTLTYNTENLPYGKSLVLDDFQKFMKRLRKKYGQGIRYLHCGEYGTIEKRPHYHACIFNHDFKDKVLWDTRRGVRLYVSESLEKIWGKGYCIIGEVNFNSAAYVARYVMKKILGDKADQEYGFVDKSTGQIIPERISEYITMSRRPGLGKAWLDKYMVEVYNTDSVIVRGREMKPPKYYDKIFDLTYSKGFNMIKGMRERRAKKHAADNTPERLQVKEICQKAKLKLLTRGYEDDS